MNIFSLNKNRIRNSPKNLHPYNLFNNSKINKLAKLPPSREGSIISTKSNNKSKINKNTGIKVKSTFSKPHLKTTKYSFNFIVQYAREKIKEQYKTPYILKLLNNKNFKYIKEEEKPIQYFFYKINDIFLKKRTSFLTNFLESNIFYSENEYLIRLFKRYEYAIIMRYLLSFVYDKDFKAHYTKGEYFYKTKLVMNKFHYLVNNNYKMKPLNEEENESSERYEQIASSSNRNFLLGKNIPSYILKRKNLIYLSEYEKLNNKIKENCFIKNPKYFLVKDMSLEKIPNPIPKYYGLGFFMNQTLKNFAKKSKFLFYEVKKPEPLKKTKIQNEEESFEELEKKKKKNTDEDISSDLSSHSERFLEEVYEDSSSEENGIFKSLIGKKIAKRTSLVFTKDNKIKEINITDNDIIDVEELIKTIDNKKEENKLIKKQLSTMSNLSRKKAKRKTRLKTRIKGFQIINTDNFQLKKIYNENCNYIQRTFSKKLTNLLYNKNNDYNNFLFGYLNFSKSNKINNNPELIRSNKYFLTSTLNKNINNELKFSSNIAQKKNRYSSKKLSTKRFYFMSKEKNKTFLSLDKLNKNKKNKYYNNYNKNIFYIHNFKNQGKIIKQRKISFSIIHNIKKIEFKETSKFITGIEKTFKKKEHQKELIKEIISNFGYVNPKKNKYGYNDNTNIPLLNQFRVKTAANIKKYKINISGSYTKNEQLLKQKEIFRDYINLKGIFKHKKIII